jgi:uncharacterized 2Fe-2S/4Fe-4S cluster protein (DUF4445 family)
VKKMPQLTIHTSDTTRGIAFSPGESLRDILDAAGLQIRSGCRGNGACGLCLVRIEGGDVPHPTKNEGLMLSAEQIRQGIRLACQLVPENDLCLRLIDAASKSAWNVLPPGRLSPTLTRLPASTSTEPAETRYGLAVDLGTTHISASLWDMRLRKRLSGRVGPNPQYAYGSDVVTRLTAAAESPETARRIARLALDAIQGALQDICGRNGINSGRIFQVAIVGNTAMLALLTETDPGVLLQPRFWTRPIACRQDAPRTWVSALGLAPSASVEIIAPVAGFVGSDLLAGVLATRLTDQPGGLLIDFGTNSEMALWDGRQLWVTSAAGGPAFEGCGIQCGMPAERGAIFHVDGENNAAGLQVEVLGGGRAQGLCGSGIVDVIAFLRRTGNLTPTGKLTISHPEEGFIVQRSHPTIRLTNRDVDVFQRAKAAIGVGIQTLLSAARMSAAELKRICVCGAFGEHLTIRHAQEIGLLPNVSPEPVELCGNTALAGCERLLLSPKDATDLAAQRRQAAIINLSRSSDFETLFLESLYLRPQRTDAR